MKKLLTLALAALMLTTSTMPVFAEDEVLPAEGLTLAEGSHLVLADNGYVDGIDGTITVGDLKTNFVGEVDVAGKADDALVCTDDVVGNYKALIYGDVNRDGNVSLKDITALSRWIAKWDVDISCDAADVDKSRTVNLLDITKMLKAAAGWDDISLGNVRMVFKNNALTAENEDYTLKLSFTNMMNKIGKTQIESTDEYSYKIKLARNEYDSCQALLWSETAKEGMTAELSEFVYEYGDATIDGKLEWVVYYPNSPILPEINPSNYNISDVNSKVIYDDFPEVVLPMADSFELKAGELQHFVITVKAEKDSPAGMYKAQLTFRDAEGNAVKTADVYAYVWDFALPDAPYSASLFCGNHTVENYDFMLDYNVNDYVLPYEITDARADAYMSDPRVTAFVIAGGAAGPNGEYGTSMYGNIMTKTPEQTVVNYNKVASNPEWFKKGLFYYTDEPWGEGLRNVKLTYHYVTDLLGTTDIRNITPLAGNGDIVDESGKTVDYVAYIDPYINVWCPQSTAFHLLSEGGLWTPRRFQKEYGEFSERAKAFKENGEEMWWYVCCSPEIPYANYFTFYQGVINRVLSWQQYFNNVDGVLYYRTFGGTITKYKFDIGNGDGVLQYEGKYWGRTGYAASWRLIQIRDGFDDFDYLRMAEELVGREAVMEVVERATSGMLRYTEDYRVLDNCRDRIAKMILEAQA